MNKAHVHSLLGLFLLACSGATTTSNPNGPPNDEPPKTDDTDVVHEAFTFVGGCNASTCGEIPSTSRASKPACSAKSGSCSWTDPDPNASVSYRQCEESACGTKPDASVCPSGTTFKGAQCGSENEGPCAWTTSCVPPRSTTPCPDPNGCGDGVPAIGVICSDGTTGGLACMKVGSKCSFQPTCD